MLVIGKINKNCILHPIRVVTKTLKYTSAVDRSKKHTSGICDASCITDIDIHINWWVTELCHQYWFKWHCQVIIKLIVHSYQTLSSNQFFSSSNNHIIN